MHQMDGRLFMLRFLQRTDNNNIIIMLLVVSFALFLTTVGCLKESHFVKDRMCDIDKRLINGCSQKLMKVSSIIHCISVCNLDDTCIGASVDENGYCFHHFVCPAHGACVSPTTNHDYRSRYCLHGTWHSSPFSSPSSFGTCQCEKAYSGQRCEKYPKDCKALGAAGYSSGYHQVYIDVDEDGYNPTPVLCDVSLPSWFSVIFMRNSGDMNYNRTWLEYQRGFYVDNSNLWGGLDSWGLLSQAGYRTVFTVTFKSQRSLYRTYYNMVFGSSSDKFKITYQMTETDGDSTLLNNGYVFGDCLGPLQGVQFSTWDNDNDGYDGENCAAKAGSGWWYPGCNNPCNLLGWGFDQWSGKSTHERFTVLGIGDMYPEKVGHLEIYLQKD